MVIANIIIGTCCGNTVVQVEVLGKGPRPGTAWVRALNGLEPFTRISHGGPYQSGTATVPIPELKDVCVAVDDAATGFIEEDPVEGQSQMPEEERPVLAPDWFLEGAAPTLRRLGE